MPDGGTGRPGSGRPGDARFTAREAVALLADDFHELVSPTAEYAPDGPLSWQGYDDSRARAAARTGEQESVVCGTATVGGTEGVGGDNGVGGTRCVLISFEFGFLGGSLGERTGDRLEAAYTYAREQRLPVVSLIATGGSRMQEGMRALAQLQRVAWQSVLTREARLPQLAVLRDPTTGGGWATLGAGADVILALPGAQVGFAGARVRPQDADPYAYTAEAQLEGGAIDAVVAPDRLRAEVALWLELLTTVDPATERVAPPPPHALAATPLPRTGWDAVQQARAPERPRAQAYLDAYFTRRAAISGDRCGGADPGMVCGFGKHDGRTVAYAAQCGTATRPAGFRTAARLVRLAGRLRIPVLTLVDTPGAANDAEAERAAAGAAIADLFAAVAASPVPITSLVIGEGGSGGALALAAPDNTWATPDSYFSVIAPELAAAILKRPGDEIRSTADQLRLRPQDLAELGVVRGIVEQEPEQTR
ncbi:carboxyl transferase domain-containing protein [Streptomyces himalayensis]|uniref:Acetyl-coenzyme A carboxylase carboxyl transferase subunits beta/alpha n=1 Tax=Streptomyces himalayensis subsp. himalayensis TaxID=2756131 RepID=A0A7W0IAX4_9ACTN|nr:carboxyl transferase domain-containing protein [Streptomyces himalayensis]MBA2948872.1 acetyl-CoA carboxylase [Streptomyces himalayensis subsp. himalayensis]